MKIRALCCKVKKPVFFCNSQIEILKLDIFMSIFQKSIEELKQKNMQFITDNTININFEYNYINVKRKRVVYI